MKNNTALPSFISINRGLLSIDVLSPTAASYNYLQIVLRDYFGYEAYIDVTLIVEIAATSFLSPGIGACYTESNILPIGNAEDKLYLIGSLS